MRPGDAASAREKGLGFEFGIDPGVPAALVGDPLRLRQVLWNLVGNAIKFTEQGGVKVQVSGSADADGQVDLVLAVSDSGIGIEPEQIKRVFEPFYQVEAAAARRFGGTGLGLPITQWLVNLMGGSLEVDSAPGRGSEFRVRLRLPRAASAPASEPGTRDLPSETTAQRLRGLSVLLVEDHPINRHVAREILAGEGAEVDVACDGQEAIARLRSHASAFDAVLIHADPALVRLDESFPAWPDIQDRALYTGYVAEVDPTVDRVHPADLWSHDWRWRDIPSSPPQEPPTTASLAAQLHRPPAPLAAQRAAERQRQRSDRARNDRGSGARGATQARWYDC